MSSNNRITDNVATVAGPPPSTKGAGRGSPDPAHTPDRRSPDPPSTATDHPSSNGSAAHDLSTNGRDDLGQFAKGNLGGPGNPFARLVAELRKSAMAAIGREGLNGIFIKMHQLALEGNIAAAKFCTAYMIGKPLPGKDPDRVDVEEWQLMKEEAPIMPEIMTQHPKTPDPILPLILARTRRYVATMDRAGMFSAALTLSPTERDRLFDRRAESPYEVCNLLREKARNAHAPPSTNGKRKKHRR